MRLHCWLSAGAPMCESLRENGENSLKANFNPPQFCKVCGRTLQHKAKYYCSPTCTKTGRRKVIRPIKNQLRIDIETMSIMAVGRKYGVSDNAIRKWMKGYGLTKPTMSLARDTSLEGAETTGEVKSS